MSDEVAGARAEAAPRAADPARPRVLRPISPSTPLLELLDPWLRRQRWYPAKGVDTALDRYASFALDAAHDAGVDGAECDLEIHLLRLRGAGVEFLVQVPVLVAAADARIAEPASDAMIGILHRGSGPVRIVDATVHPAGWAALLRCVTWHADPPTVDVADGRALGQEQSNSSFVLPRTAGGLIVKVMRTVTLGPHPDVAIPVALAAQGWDGVPPTYGWIAVDIANRADPAHVDGASPPPTGADLAVVSKYLADADDGFLLARDLARDGIPFDRQATELGRAVATMHEALRRVYGTAEAVDAGRLVAELRRRCADSVAAAPALAARTGRLDAFWARTAACLRSGPDDILVRQTIHGDLHLGQALYTASGWRIIDFEGEPARPAADRSRPDLPLRDVAGVLRSIDYAASIGQAEAQDWADAARRAFCTGYRAGGGAYPEAADPLLDALALDKALYEVAYETRNRPDWVRIPLAAVDQILRAVD